MAAPAKAGLWRINQATVRRAGSLPRASPPGPVARDREALPIDGAFVFIGLDPNTGFLKGGDIVLDRWGFISTGHALTHGDHRPKGFENRDPGLLETSVPGVFAAGDVRDNSTKQVVSAAGEGSAAALLIREHLKTV